MRLSTFALYSHNCCHFLVFLTLFHLTLARNVIHWPREDSISKENELISSSSPASMHTAIAVISTSVPIFLVTQPTISPTSISASVLPPEDKQMNMKFVIPIVVGTFLASAAITLLSIYFYCRRRRLRNLHSKHSQSGMTALPSTPRSPFIQSPAETYLVSPLSPANGHLDNKDGRLPSMNIFGDVLIHEVGSGRRTPQEVLGDTTWGKGDLSPDACKVSTYTPIQASDRFSRCSVVSGSPASPRG